MRGAWLEATVIGGRVNVWLYRLFRKIFVFLACFSIHFQFKLGEIQKTLLSVFLFYKASVNYVKFSFKLVT